MNNRIILFIVLTLLAGGRFTVAQERPAPAATKRPNIIFILTDDQRWDALGCAGHPFLKTPNLDRLRNEGVLFKNAFVTTSLCSPSRASFLTGTYVHTHGVIGNEVAAHDPDWDKTPSFAMLLQKAGYRTGYIGKWHMAPNNRPRPGFDYWFGFKGQGVYVDPVMNEDGTEKQVKGYITEILNDSAVAFINRAAKDKPFLLYLSHKAVHDPRTVRERDRDLYSGQRLPKPPNFDDDLAGKPKWQRLNVLSHAKLNEPIDVDNIPDRLPPRPFGARNQDTLNYFRLLTAVDDGVGMILRALAERGDLDDTVIVFAGDNGYFFGEHRVGDKRLAYEESLRIPMLLRYPRLAKAGSTIEKMVLNIDLAPTLLDLAAERVPPNMQGRSWRPLLQGKADGWRTSFLYEYWLDLKPTIPDMVGVRTDEWKLVRYPNIRDLDEMYDLKSDPYELHNLAQNTKYAAKATELSTELDRLMRETNYVDPPNPAKKRLRTTAP
jgi:N-acetylglucosamine-6-sulfatase